MSAHTPGPWRSEYPIIYSVKGARLLTVDEYDCATIYDARLIAAAPDLLAALHDCVAVMSRELNGLAVIQPELAQALAAIDKAIRP